MSYIKIACAFCDGKGTDPFDIISPLSKCQVCFGRGIVSVEEKTAECIYCKGSGRHPELRLTCPVCRGKGVVHIEESKVNCPECKGTGKTPGNKLPCLICEGKGTVYKEAIKWQKC